MAWTSGQLLDNGNYQIEKVLGIGGFGNVYLATSRKYGPVVIKTLNDEVQQEPNFDSFQTAFMNEALEIRGCQHPHIVICFEWRSLTSTVSRVRGYSLFMARDHYRFCGTSGIDA